MMIINEELVGKELDKNGVISNQHAAQNIHILIKYYQHIGKTNEEIIQLLDEKINIKQDVRGTAKDYLYRAAIRNINYNGKFRDGILDFSTNELEEIHKLDNINLEKIMFTILSLYKSFGQAPHIKKAPLLRMAMITSKTSYFDDCVSILDKLGYINIRENKRKERNRTIYEVVYDLGKNFPQYEEVQKCLTVHDTNTPVLFYLMYYNICNIQFCEECGEPYIQQRKRPDGHTYCQNCRKQQKKEYDKRYYKTRKQKGLKNSVDNIP